MAYVGDSLTQLFNKEQQEVRTRIEVDAVGVALDRWHEFTAMNTPVRTGNLRTNWSVGPTRPTTKGHEGHLENPTSYAKDVEYGTGLYGPLHAKYLIEPKKPGGFLRWIGKDGKEVFAKRVMHPGSPGNHMLAIGAAMTEAAAHGGGLFEGLLRRWAAEWESIARSR